MALKRSTWLTFITLSAVSIFIWFQFSYPQLNFLNFSVSRNTAFHIAEKYLIDAGYDHNDYHSAIVFNIDGKANRYLQKTLGFKELTKFLKEEDYDMFYWTVRFFKEEQKEEFFLEVSSSTGEIISFLHVIDEGEPREDLEREVAKNKAREFLKTRFNFDESKYFLKADLLTKRDYRSDYTFSWQKEEVAIPWSKEPNSGIGKLVTFAKISGREVLSFTKGRFRVPDQFKRELTRQQNVGQNLHLIIRVLIMLLFTASIYFVIVRRNHLAMHTTKRFYLGIMIISFVLTLLATFNFFEEILFDYKTTTSINAYLLHNFSNTIYSALFLTVALLMPSLAGELLHFETSKENRLGSLLSYIRSTFLSRSVTTSILVGYFSFVIMLGIQATLFKIGQDHWGVWIEHSFLTNATSAFFPFLAILSIAFKASLSEEIMYRMFALNWGNKIFKNTFISAVIMSIVWGFAHSNYPVFPQWFRGIEVTCLGFFLSFIYLRFGLISTLVAHFLFDAFWQSSGFLLGTTSAAYFFPTLGILLIPLLWGIGAFILNRSDELKDMRWLLNKHQKYNLKVLQSFMETNKDHFTRMSPAEIQQEISNHGWDPAVIEMAILNEKEEEEEEEERP